VFLLEGERNALGSGHERFHAITPEAELWSNGKLLKDNSFKRLASKGKCSLRVCVGSERVLLTGNLMKHSPLARLRPPAVVPGEARAAFGPNPHPISGGAL
jgi:hypothetical protein